MWTEGISKSSKRISTANNTKYGMINIFVGGGTVGAIIRRKLTWSCRWTRHVAGDSSVRVVRRRSPLGKQKNWLEKMKEWTGYPRRVLLRAAQDWPRWEPLLLMRLIVSHEGLNSHDVTCMMVVVCGGKGCIEEFCLATHIRVCVCL